MKQQLASADKGIESFLLKRKLLGCVLLKLLSSIKVLQDKDYLIDHVCIYKKNTCVANHTTKKNIKDKGM